MILVNESNQGVSVLEDLNVPGYTRVQVQFEDSSPVINLNSAQWFTVNLIRYQDQYNLTTTRW